MLNLRIFPGLISGDRADRRAHPKSIHGRHRHLDIKGIIWWSFASQTHCSSNWEISLKPSGAFSASEGKPRAKRLTLDWQRCNMFRDYTAVSSKMKSNYSKLYDITAVQWNAHCYVIPLTNSEGFMKTLLRIPQILHTQKTKRGGTGRNEMSRCYANWVPSQKLKLGLGLEKHTFYFNI